MPIPTSGDVCRHFFSQYFSEDGSQQPEFALGPTALRRVQLVQLGLKADLAVHGNMPKNDLVRIIEGAMMDGVFDNMMQPMATEHQQAIATLMGENESLQRANDQMSTRLSAIEAMLEKMPGVDLSALGGAEPEEVDPEPVWTPADIETVYDPDPVEEPLEEAPKPKGRAAKK